MEKTSYKPTFSSAVKQELVMFSPYTWQKVFPETSEKCLNRKATSFRFIDKYKPQTQELITKRDKLPRSFKEYLPNFRLRLRRSLRKSPTDNIRNYRRMVWDENFFESLNKVDSICTQEHVCGHGLDHVTHVAQNALALVDAIPNKYKIDGKLSDENLIFTSLIHDIGYATAENWQDYHAHDHEEKSSEWLNSHKKTHEHSLKLKELFSKTIGSSKAEIKSIVEDPSIHTDSDNLFKLTLWLADKLDYFRKERVEAPGVEQPSLYEDNPYFFHANAVKKYEITSDEDNIYYAVEIEKTNIKKNSSKQHEVNFDWWKKEIEDQYPSIINLGEGFAKVVNKKFVIKELNCNTRNTC